MSEGLISVIIPVYNAGAYLQKCLDSIIGQTYKNLEIILIDDGSTDGSSKICDEYAKKDARVVCVHQLNSGVSAARNRGLKIANGEYIHFPDSDDYLELDTYEYLLGLLKKHDCDVVNFEHYITYSQKEIEHKFSEDRYGLFDVEGSYKQFVNGVQFCWNKLFKSTLIFEKKEVEELYFREDIYRGEDALFAAQVISRAKKIWFDSRPLYHYVQTEESATRGKFRASQLSFLKLYEAYEPLYKKYPNVWNNFLLFMQEGSIMIYFDMWVDKEDYRNEKKWLIQTYRRKKKTLVLRGHSLKRRCKINFFSVAPNLFCLTHKILHKI